MILLAVCWGTKNTITQLLIFVVWVKWLLFGRKFSTEALSNMSHNLITRVKISYITTSHTSFDSSLGSVMLGSTFHSLLLLFFDQVRGAKMPDTPFLWQTSWFVWKLSHKAPLSNLSNFLLSVFLPCWALCKQWGGSLICCPGENRSGFFSIRGNYFNVSCGVLWKYFELRFLASVS